MERVSDREGECGSYNLTDEFIGLCLAVGNAQWKSLGTIALEDANKWREYIEKARKEFEGKSTKLFIAALFAASDIEKKWPTFDMVAGKIFSTLITHL
jgi:hypothetical protein